MTKKGAVLGVLLAGAVLPVWAAEFSLGGGIEAKVTGVFTLGASLRTEEQNPAVLGTLSTARVGQGPGQLGGNSGGNDLNFGRGKPVSTVLKGFVDLELKRQNLGLFLRGRGWYDYELHDGDRPYGNIPNRFAQNVPLSDKGFQRDAKFTGLRFADAYLFGRFQPAQDYELDARLGRQVVHWGTAQFVAGGINAVNGLDLAASVRPGAQLDELRVPTGMLYANLAARAGWGIDGWYQYEFRPGVQNGCGTFFAQPNYSPPGCNYVSVLGGAGVNDPNALQGGLYPKRGNDVLASDSGQWGLSGRYHSTALNTEFRGYAMNIHARAPFILVTNPNIAGGYGANVNSRLQDPNGLKYQMAYPEDIRAFGLSFDTRASQAVRAYGEYSYRPNQPLGINASDLIAAFLNRGALSALNLARGTNALPPGATFEGWDRYKVSMMTLGVASTFPGLLGAASVTATGEIGWSHVYALPDPGTLRYGRSDDYGLAQVNGGAACVDNTAAKKSCQQNGFITSDAWGLRFRLAARYPGALFGAALVPSIFLGKDMKGNSYGGFFLEDRWVVRPAIRAEWQQVFTELSYTRTGGGDYNTLVDRDLLTWYIGARF